MSKQKFFAQIRHWHTRVKDLANAGFGSARALLRVPHNHLLSRSRHYRTWHEQPHHMKVHRHVRNFSALIGFAVIFGYTFASYQALRYTFSPSSAFASGSSVTWGATHTAFTSNWSNTTNTAVTASNVKLTSTSVAAALVDTVTFPGTNNTPYDIFNPGSGNVVVRHTQYHVPGYYYTYGTGTINGTTDSVVSDTTDGGPVSIEYPYLDGVNHGSDTRGEYLAGGNVTQFYIADNNNGGFATGLDHEIYFDPQTTTVLSDGSIWILSQDNNSVSIISEVGGVSSVSSWAVPPGSPHYSGIARDASGNIWASYGTAGLYKYNSSGAIVTHVTGTGTSYTDDIHAITYHNGYIYGCSSSYIYRIDTTTNSVTRWSGYNFNSPGSGWLKQVSISSDGSVGYVLDATQGSSWSVQAFDPSNGALFGDKVYPQHSIDGWYIGMMVDDNNHAWATSSYASFGTYVDKISLSASNYSSPGLATASYAPGGTNKWTGATPTADTTPSGTGLTLTYCDTVGGTYVSDITSLPRSTTLYIKADLTTSNSANTPTLSGLTVNYDPVTVTVSAPNGGENIKYNNSTTTPISWSTSGTNSGDLIHLQYSTNSGSSYSDITGATALDPASGSYNWTIYNDLQTTSATVKVKAILENSSHTELANDPSNAVLTLTYDNTAPTIAISSPSDNSTTGTATATITGTASDASGIASITSSASGAVTGTTSWSQTVTLSSGANTITYTAHDNAGNTADAVIHITYSSALPTISITPPASSLVNSASLTIAGTASSSNGISSVTSNYAGSVTGATSWSQTVTLSAGANHIVYTAHDGLGGTNTASVDITLDTTNPGITITGPVTTLVTTGTATITGTASDANGIASVTSDAAGSVTGTTSWSQTVTLSEGANLVTLTAHDTAGNTSTANITITKDSIAPTISITGPTGSGLIIASTTANVTGTASDAGGLASITSSDSNTVTGTTSWNENVALLTDGEHPFTFTAHDTAGNTSTATITITRDTTAPVISNYHIRSTNRNSWMAKDGDTIVVSFTVSENLYEAPVVQFANGYGAPKVLALQGGFSPSTRNYTYSITVDWWDLTGPVSASISLKDALENSDITYGSTQPNATDLNAAGYNTVIIDLSPPTVTWGAGYGSSGGNNYWDIYTQSATFTANSVAYDNVGVETVTSGTVGTSIVAGSADRYGYTQTVTLKDGENDISYIATDYAGNVTTGPTIKVFKSVAPPEPPDPVSVTCDSNSCSLQWGYLNKGSISNFIIEMRGDSNFTAPTRGTDYSGGSAQSGLNASQIAYKTNADGGHTFTGLSPTTTYHFAIYAVGSAQYVTGNIPVYSTPATIQGTTTSAAPRTPVSITIDSPSSTFMSAPNQNTVVKGTAHGDSGARVSATFGQFLTQTNTNGTIAWTQTVPNVCIFAGQKLDVTYTVSNKFDNNSTSGSILLQCDSKLPPYPSFENSLSNAPTVTVAVFSPSRVFTSAKSGVWSVSQGDVYKTFRSIITNAANFSATGTVKKNIFYKDIDSVTPDSMRGVDLLVISPLDVKKPLSAIEGSLINQFVKQGGGLLEARNIRSGDNRPMILGTSGGPFVGDSRPTITSTGSGTPIMNGPFGSVSGVIGFGANGVLSQSGNATVVMRNTQGPNFLMFAGTDNTDISSNYDGKGNAVIIGDEELFMDGVNPGEYAGQMGITNNQKLLENTIAFLVKNAPNANTPSYQVDPLGHLSAAAGSNFVKLTFDTIPLGMVADIYRSTDPNQRGDLITTTIDNGMINSYIDSTINPDVAYYYSAILKWPSLGLSSTETKSNSISVTRTYSVNVGSNGTLTVKTGESLKPTVAVIDNFTNSPISNPALIWSIDGPYATVTPDGTITGVKVGGSQTGLNVIFQNGTQSVSRVVPIYVVTENVVIGVGIDPGSVTLKTGTKQQYVAVLTNQNGTSYRPADLGYSAAWTATGGIIDKNGLYTAGTTNGNFQVTLTATKDSDKWTATARLTISNDKLILTNLTMTAGVRVPVGTQVRMWSNAFDQFNNVLRMKSSNDIHYSNSDPEIGYIDNIGMFYANNKEKCDEWVVRVDYTYDGVTLYAISRINTTKYSPSDIDKFNVYRNISFTNGSYVWVTKPGESRQYTGYVINGFGVLVPGKQLVWEMADPKAGSITSSGDFTASATEKIYPRSVRLSIKDIETGALTQFGLYTATVSSQEQKITTLTTNNVGMKPYSYGTTYAYAYDQFGYNRPFSIYNWNLSLEHGGGDLFNFYFIKSGAAGTFANTIKSGAYGISTQVKSQGTVSALDTNQVNPANWCGATTGGTPDPPVVPSITGGDEPIIVPPPGGQIVLPGSIVDEAIKQQDRVDLIDQVFGGFLGRIIARTGKAVPGLPLSIGFLSAISILAAIPTLLEFLLELLARLLGRLASLLQLLSLRRRPRTIGRVFKGKTKDPVVAATVSIIDAITLVVIDSERTDSTGQYTALINSDPKKKYILRVVADGYEKYEQKIQADDVNQIVRLGLKLENDDRKLIRLARLQAFIHFLDLVRLPLLILGTFTWISVVFYNPPSWQNNALGLYYLLAWLLEWYISHLPRPYGLVMDEETISPLPLVVIRITNQKDRIVATEVTNIRGQFKTLLPRGIYTFTFSKADYVTVSRTGIILDRQSRAVNVDVEMGRETRGE